MGIHDTSVPRISDRICSDFDYNQHPRYENGGYKQQLGDGWIYVILSLIRS